MKKRINIEAIESELTGSVFFSKTPKAPLEDTPPVAQTPATTSQDTEEQKPLSPLPKPSQKKAILTPRYRDTTIPSNHDTVIPQHRDTTIPTNHNTTIPEQYPALEEEIRKAVKQIGKEAATFRFTETEKEALADIEYSYKRQGIRTSGNEITRIGLNFLIEDYHRNGENSILAKILKLLNA